MASPTQAEIARVSPDPIVRDHYAAQKGVTVALILALRKLWKLLDLRDTKSLQATLPGYITGVEALVQHFGSASAYLASENFSQLRVQAGITDSFRVPLVDPPQSPQIEASMRWATSDLWKALEPVTADLTIEVIDRPPLAEVEQAAQTRVEGAASKLVTDTGRNEMLEAIIADKRARGYARITRPGACYFCMMLAGRGAVYDKDSFDKSNAKFTGAGNAKAHDEDHCTLQPIFSDHFEPSADVREAKALYDEVTKNKRGSKAKTKAFRRAYEGRADGPERTARSATSKPRSDSSKRNPIDTARDIDASQSTAELQATLDSLEASAKKFDSAGLKRRRDELRRKIAARD